MLKRLKAQQGFTFVEVLIALLVLSVFAVTFLMGLAVSSHAVIVADERTTAESLARSQMESVKHDTYMYAEDGGVTNYTRIDSDIPAGYAIWSEGRDGVAVDGIVGVPWSNVTGQAVAKDTGLQRIKLIVKHGEKTVWTLEGFNAER